MVTALDSLRYTTNAFISKFMMRNTQSWMIYMILFIQGGGAQMRFQPRVGRYLAAAAENVVSILDVETQACCHSLQVVSVF